MKISPISPNIRTKITKTNLLKQHQGNQQLQSNYNNTNPIDYMPHYKLISFGAKPTDFEQQRMEHDQQLLNLQARKEQILEKIEKARQYDEKARREHYKRLIIEEQRNLGFFASFSDKKNQAIHDKYQQAFNVEYAQISSIYEQMDDLKAEWELIERGEVNIEKALKKLDELEKNWNDFEEVKQKTLNDFEKEKQLKIKKAQKINDILKGKGGLDDCIAGYEEQKNAVVKNFLEPIMAEIDTGVEHKVPNSMLLYGATGTGKTTFTQALINNIKIKVNNKKNELKNVVKVNVETLVISDEGSFIEDIKMKLDEAETRYKKSKPGKNETGTRTVYVVNEVESHLDKTKAVSNGTIQKNINYMKSLLDKCAELPNPNNKGAYATTFFFTTNYPTKIHDDILLREGKIGLKIALNPAEKNDIKEILKFYVQKASNLIKHNHPKLIFDPESIPYEKLAEELQPTKEQGAFSNDVLQAMIMRRGAGRSAGAMQRYEEAPKKSFASHLADIVLTEKRDLTEDRFEAFVKIYKEMEGGEIDNVKLLLKKEALGMVDEAEKQTLKILKKTKKI